MWHTSCFEWLLYRSSKMRILCLYLTRVTMMSKRLYKYCSPRWLSLCRHQMPCSWLLLKAALTCSLILARYFSFLLVLVCQRSMWERGYNLFCDEYLFWETDSSFSSSFVFDVCAFRSLCQLLKHVRAVQAFVSSSPAWWLCGCIFSLEVLYHLSFIFHGLGYISWCLGSGTVHSVQLAGFGMLFVWGIFYDWSFLTASVSTLDRILELVLQFSPTSYLSNSS